MRAQVKDTPSSNGVVDVEAIHIRDGSATAEACRVVAEDALILDVQDIGHYTLMWTPTTAAVAAQGFTLEDGLLGEEPRPEGLCLAMGFALSEGLIERLADIRSLSICPDDPGVVRLQLHDPDKVRTSRKNQLITSSCGICGPREILQDNVLQLSSAGDTLRITASQFALLMERMRDDQAIFQQTGGSHAAGIFDASGQLITVAEDLGRHNALDKAIGMALLQRDSVDGFGVVLSSRLSLEMVLKAVRAGLEMMLAVSAPTSLAIEVAQAFGITLCGFVREGRATVYCHPQRVLDAAPPSEQRSPAAQ